MRKEKVDLSNQLEEERRCVAPRAGDTPRASLRMARDQKVQTPPPCRAPAVSPGLVTRVGRASVLPSLTPTSAGCWEDLQGNPSDAPDNSSEHMGDIVSVTAFLPDMGVTIPALPGLCTIMRTPREGSCGGPLTRETCTPRAHAVTQFSTGNTRLCCRQVLPVERAACVLKLHFHFMCQETEAQKQQGKATGNTLYLGVSPRAGCFTYTVPLSYY